MRKKFITALLAVECNAWGISWCNSLLLGRGLCHLGFSSRSGSTSWVRAALTYYNGACGRAVLLTTRWASVVIYLFCSSTSAFMKWARNTLREVLIFSYEVQDTTCTATWSPCGLENGARSLLLSKFRQLKFPSVKPNHTVPLAEGRRFSVGNLEQTCSSQMPSAGASPLSKGYVGSPQRLCPLPRRGPFHHCPPCALLPSLLFCTAVYNWMKN